MKTTQRTAKDFHVGQRVRLTDKALRRGLQGNARTRMGTVRRLGTYRREGWKDIDTTLHIFVQRDGMKGTESYHCDFWEPVEEPGKPPEGIANGLR